MNLVFKTLDIEHFRCFAAKQTFCLTPSPGLWFLRGRNEVEPQLGSNGCLIGDTLIDCPRDLRQFPKGIPIKDLVGKQFLTYSWDAEKDTMVLSPVLRVWCTGTKPVYRVKVTAYPTGRQNVGTRKGGNILGKFLPPCELVGTKDHLVMLSDGSWRPLGELRPKDSLKSFYRRDADRGKISWSDSVIRVRPVAGWHGVVENPYEYYGLTKAVSEQQFVCREVWGPRLPGEHVHHKDENELNHSPNNLVWKNGKRHAADHLADRNRKGTAGWRITGKHPRGMKGKKQSKAARKRISEGLKKAFATRKRVPNHRVVSVEFVGLEPVYDMEVENTHNFVANGIVVHNSGKSSLVTALCWVIYGQTPHGLRNTDIKPWQGKGTPKGTLTLLIDEEPFSISRTAKTNGLAINGKEVGAEEGAKLLGLPFEVLTNTIFLAQGQPLFFDRTPKEKLALFTDTLRLERWEERSVKASKKVKELETLESEMTGERSGLDVALTQAEALLKSAQAESADWEDAREECTRNAEKTLVELAKERSAIQAKLNKADLDHDGAWVRLREMREDIEPLQEAVAKAREALNVAEFTLAADERDAARLKRELKTLGESDNCPTCGQPVTGTSFGKHKKELLAQIRALETRIESGIPKKLSQAYAEAQKLASGLAAQITEAEKVTDTLQTTLNHYQPLMAELNSKIALLKASTQANAEESNPYVNQIQDLRRQKAKLTRDIEALDEDILKAQRQIERTKFWIKGFRDLALSLLDETLQELESVTNSMLPEVGLEGWYLKYDLERETKAGSVQRGINIVVSPVGQGGAWQGEAWRGLARPGMARRGVGEEGASAPSSQFIKWESWSGGESQRLRLVGALALSEVLLRHAGVSSNLEILDEPTQHLSASGVQDLCAYLSDRAKAGGKTVWLIDHSAREGAAFAGTVTVTKTAKGSIITA